MAHLIHTLAKIGYAELPMDDFKSIQDEFHKAFRKQYPDFKPESKRSIEINLDGNEVRPVEQKITSYTLTSFDKSDGAIVTSSDIVLHTKNYISIDNFWQKLETLLCFVHEKLEINYIDYIGIRYFNQLKSYDPNDLIDLVKRPDVLQPILHSQPTMQGSFMQSRYENEEGMVHLCSGIVIEQSPLPREMLPLAQRLDCDIDSEGVNVVVDIDSFYCPQDPEPFKLEKVREKMYSLRTQAKAVYIEIVEDLDEKL